MTQSMSNGNRRPRLCNCGVTVALAFILINFMVGAGMKEQPQTLPAVHR